MDDAIVEESDGKAHIVRLSGVAVKTYKTRKEAEAYRRAVIEEPELFLTITEWEPKELYRFVDFEEDKEHDG